MGLVMMKQNVYRTYTEDLTKKWIPAILTYCKGSKRKDVKDLIDKKGTYLSFVHTCDCFCL